MIGTHDQMAFDMTPNTTVTMPATSQDMERRVRRSDCVTRAPEPIALFLMCALEPICTD